MNPGSQKVSQTTTTQLSPEQQQLLGLALPPIKQYAATPTKLPTTPLTAPFAPEQTAGQEQALAAVPKQQQLANTGAGASDFLLNYALYPSTNPALQDTINAAVRPIVENAQTITAPGIRNDAVAAGQFGGSRQGIAEGIAQRALDRQIGDTSAGIATAGYQSGLDAMIKALGLLPQTQGAQIAPALTTSGVGDVRQAQTQSALDELLYRSMFGQLEPLQRGQNIAGIASGIPGGSTQSTGTYPGQSPLSGVLGGATLGGSLLGVPGALGGGALGLLLSLI